ncbi:MAG: outer membrane lipoprotein chaperone LolA [Deltaproteobacteria bacterium]|nr:outer membrane lipoprotein chaperone LolA [Candidatus Tharpella sp.]
MAGTVEKSSLPAIKIVVPTKIEESKAVEKIDTKEILARIRAQYRKEQAFSGSFTQTTTYGDSNDTTLSTGLIWIQGPDKMRWEYQVPEKQLLVSDGKTLWYHTPDLNQVMVGSVKDIKEARIIVNLLSEIKEELKGLNLLVTKSNKQITVVLSPLANDQAPPFQNLEMIFSESSLALIETRMVDLFANKIVITYRWKSGPDKALPRSHFTFILPAGCDVMPLGQ